MNKHFLILLRGIVILLIGLLLIPLVAIAGERDRGDRLYLPPTLIIREKPPETAYIAPETDHSGIALGIANAQTNFDFGTHKWQWSAGAGYYEGETGLAFGIGKRVDRVLVNGTISREGNENGYGVGLHGRY